MNIRSTRLVVFNTVTLIAMLVCNYGSSTGLFGGATVADISYRYDTLFAPAGFAFIIWGVIFLFCIGFVGYQWKLLNASDPQHFIDKTGWWFAVGNVANGLWVFSWTNDLLTLSVLLILILLVSLIILVLRLRAELDHQPLSVMAFVMWPVAIYLGWVMVATIACIAAWLVSLGWRGGPVSEPAWTIALITIGTILYLMLLGKRNLRESVAVGCWAFAAIAVRQWHLHESIAYTAVAAASLLFVANVVHAIRQPGKKGLLK